MNLITRRESQECRLVTHSATEITSPLWRLDFWHLSRVALALACSSASVVSHWPPASYVASWAGGYLCRYLSLLICSVMGLHLCHLAEIRSCCCGKRVFSRWYSFLLCKSCTRSTSGWTLPLRRGEGGSVSNWKKYRFGYGSGSGRFSLFWFNSVPVWSTRSSVRFPGAAAAFLMEVKSKNARVYLHDPLQVVKINLQCHSGGPHRLRCIGALNSTMNQSTGNSWIEKAFPPLYCLVIRMPSHGVIAIVRGSYFVIVTQNNGI